MKKIYSIKHPAFRGEVYMTAQSIRCAIEKFKNQYEASNVNVDDIESVKFIENVKE